MRWPHLFLRLALALSLQPALGLLSSKGCLSRSAQRQQPSHPLVHRCSSSSGLPARPTRRLPPALAAQQLPQHRRHQHHLCISTQSTPAAAAARPGCFSSGDVSQRSARQRTAWSTTALALAAGRGVPGEAGDGAEEGAGKDGWRQRMVRTIMSVFLRMREVVAAVGARLGLGGSSKVRGSGGRCAWCNSANAGLAWLLCTYTGLVRTQAWYQRLYIAVFLHIRS